MPRGKLKKDEKNILKILADMSDDESSSSSESESSESESPKKSRKNNSKSYSNNNKLNYDNSNNNMDISGTTTKTILVGVILGLFLGFAKMGK